MYITACVCGALQAVCVWLRVLRGVNARRRGDPFILAGAAKLPDTKRRKT